MALRVVCDVCGTEYQLKDELAGQRVRCSSCENVLNLPTDVGPTATVVDRPDLDPSFRRDKFLLRQKHLSISQKYYVWDEQGQPILFVERPAHLLRNLGALFAALLALVGAGIVVVIAFSFSANMGLNHPATAGIVIILGLAAIVVAPIVAYLKLMAKRHITFYGDDSKAVRLLEVLQDQKVALLNATYTVNDPAGSCLARFRKNYLYNLFRRRWYGYHPDGSPLVVVKEDSLILALLRRVLGTFFGILRTNYVILTPGQDRVLGEFNRKFTLLDRYVLDMSHDPEHLLDRRLAVAIGVLLDTGERR